MRTLTRAVLVVLVVAVVAVVIVARFTKGKDDRGIPNSFAGLWTGTVSQSNPADSSTVSIVFAPHSSTGGISYGDDLCSGELRRTGTGSSTRISFRQRLTYNPGNACVANGSVTLSQPTGSTIAFRFSGSHNASGTLHRP